MYIISTHIRIYIYICVCVCVYIYIHTHTHTHTHTHKQTHARAYTCIWQKYERIYYCNTKEDKKCLSKIYVRIQRQKILYTWKNNFGM